MNIKIIALANQQYGLEAIEKAVEKYLLDLVEIKFDIKTEPDNDKNKMAVRIRCEPNVNNIILKY